MIHVFDFANVIDTWFIPDIRNVTILKLKQTYILIVLSYKQYFFLTSINYLSACFQGMYIKSTYDGLHVITGTTENVSLLSLKDCCHACKYLLYICSVFFGIKTCCKPRHFLSILFYLFVCFTHTMSPS